MTPTEPIKSIGGSMNTANKASEDELKERIGNLHAYNFDGDDVTVKVMVDEDILESIAKFVEALIRTEKLKLLAEVRERVIGEDENMTELEPYGDRYSTVCDRNAFRSEQLESLNKLEAEL